MNNIKEISTYQTMLLMVIYRVIIAFTYLPAVNTPPGNQDIWIMVLLSSLYTIILCLPILYLSNKLNDLTIIEYTEKVMGKIIGKAIGIFYTGFLLIFSIVFVGILVEILDTTMFPETPTLITTTIMLLTCIYISYKGLEVIARGTEIFVPFILGVIFMFMVLGYPNYDFTVLLPVLSDSTFKEINIGAIDIALKFSDIIILAMITPHLGKKEDLNKIFFKSLIYSIIIIILVVIFTQAALGIEFIKHTNFPFFTFTRLINLLDFIQRVDALYVVAWITGNVGKIAGYLYFTTVAFSQIVNKQKNQPYIIPIAVIILIVTVLIKDRYSILGVGETLQKIILIMSFITIFVIPLITLIVYFFRRKKLS